jgi:hypothetical protein
MQLEQTLSALRDKFAKMIPESTSVAKISPLLICSAGTSRRQFYAR